MRTNGTVLDEFWADAHPFLQKFAGDRERLEQYSDYLRNRMFRRTLLCRGGVKVQDPVPAAVRQMWIVSPLRRQASHATVEDNQPMRFGNAANNFIQASLPATKAALMYLQECFPLRRRL